MEDKKIISKKTHKIELTEYEDGSTLITRTNDGFEFFELYGVICHTKKELDKIYAGDKEIAVDRVKRVHVTD